MGSSGTIYLAAGMAKHACDGHKWWRHWQLISDGSSIMAHAAACRRPWLMQLRAALLAGGRSEAAVTYRLCAASQQQGQSLLLPCLRCRLLCRG
jgi:hypothetical protein